MNDKKILLVDDDPMSVEFMKIYLESQGFEVFCAHSFVEASAFLAEGSFPILITDMQLSDGSGVDLAKYAREKTDNSIKIIGVTGYSKQDIEKESGSTTLFNAVLTKPIDLSKLSEKLGFY